MTGPDDEGKCGRVGEVGVIAFKGDRDDWLVRFGDDQQRAWYAGGSLKGAEL
ncbi:hypothetical protein Q0M94_28450 (plasmid) [Deinococcus radiomollis]|uniref:hypothetical protein n=1 Tax=Deinococcus radiomollis TaxID=468916 RepID=UPI003891ECA8